MLQMAWITCTFEEIPFMLKGACRFWSDACHQPDNIFVRDGGFGGFFLFQQNKTKPLCAH